MFDKINDVIPEYMCFCQKNPIVLLDKCLFL